MDVVVEIKPRVSKIVGKCLYQRVLSLELRYDSPDGWFIFYSVPIGTVLGSVVSCQFP